MLWKRLNDHGKNWRHVYKALVLLEYIIKNGNEKVINKLYGVKQNRSKEFLIKNNPITI